jgi:hypothetical protein
LEFVGEDVEVHKSYVFHVGGWIDGVGRSDGKRARVEELNVLGEDF